MSMLERPRAAVQLRRLPGVLVAFGAVAVGVGLQKVFVNVSPLLTALILGIVLANSGLVPAARWKYLEPGFALASRRFLRVGIVVLGMQIVLRDVIGLGAGILGLVLAVVVLGILSTLGLGALLRVPTDLRILIACGFSICGAAAMAGTSEVIEADEEDVAAGIALVALFGTAMIGIIPALGALLGLDDRQTGMWAGGSIHEVAQVVAVGGSIGGTALTVAVLVKLARVMMLAPVAAALAVWHRRRSPGKGAAGRPPILPLFVVGFIAMALVRATGVVPLGAVHIASTVQLWFLASAMFAIGCGCSIATMRRLGWRSIALGALSTAAVATISLTGIVALS